MRNLRLPLKRNWFEMTKSGIKSANVTVLAIRFAIKIYPIPISGL